VYVKEDFRSFKKPDGTFFAIARNKNSKIAIEKEHFKVN
jgi:hypothetical protein